MVDSVTESKRCTKCGLVKLLSEFYHNKKSKDGHCQRCKECIDIQNQEYEKSHREETRAYKLSWWHHNPKKSQALEAARAYAQRHYSECKEEKLRYAKEYRALHGESIREWKRKNYESHKEEERERHRKYHRTERGRKSKQRWRQAHPGYQLVERYRRRVAKRDGTFRREHWEEMCRLVDISCPACGLKVKLTLDHIVPLVLGGTNDITNVQPLCLSCNSKKYVHVIDYRPERLRAWANEQAV